MLSGNLKAVYDEEFKRAAENDRERVSFKVQPAQAYTPQEVICQNVKFVVMNVIVVMVVHAAEDNANVQIVNVKRRKNE